MALLLALVGGMARAEPALLVCYPNAPGTTESAKPVMEQLGAQIGGEAVYFNDLAAANAWIESHGQPTCAIVSLGVYLRWREPHGLQPVAATERHGSTRERFYLLVAQDAPYASLEAFGAARPTLWSGHLDNPTFAERVIFARGLALGERATQVVSTAQPLRALRRLKGGREFEGRPVDGVLLDASAWKELQQLASFKGKVRVLFESAELPTPPVVSFANSDPAAVAALRAKLLGLGERAEGKKLLETLQLTAFRPADPEALEPVVAAYEAPQ
ncbi:MAG: PhnD/SsuA/transferrin family substrate-binding protein [Planctomycetes bacterium]|nr:PhnD/SsuA/transferrin family substrate-binding protein [Planctomycetota bacterium]